MLQMVQPMMPGMAPPPPGAYMPGPYMQPMPYPMPPPNGASFVRNMTGVPGSSSIVSSYVPVDAHGTDASYVILSDLTFEPQD